MQEAQVRFSLILIFKVRIPDIQNFREMRKVTLYHKTFEEHGQIRKIKIHM